MDNEFYLLSVKEMDMRHYEGKWLGYYNDDNSPKLEKSRFEKKTSFYIAVPKMAEDIEYRKKYSK